MSQAKKSKPTEEFSEIIARRLKEGALILLCAVAFFLLMSLVTYTNVDPGWSRT